MFCMTIFAMIFSFGFFGVENYVANATEIETYESFDNSVSEMVGAFDYHNDVERIVLDEDEFYVEDNEVFVSSQSAKKLGFKSADKFLASSSLEGVSASQIDDKLVLTSVPGISRLIVVSHKKLSSCGAISKAEYSDYHIFQYKNLSDAQKAYNYYSSLDFVESVEFDQIISANDVIVEPDATSYNSWGWQMPKDLLGANEYLDALLSNYSQSELQQIVVAVLDSGINTSHPLLQNRIVYQYGKDFTGEASQTAYKFEDYYKHGSHVSGTIAEITLDNVKILPLKVLNSSGNGTLTMIVNAVLYVNELVEHGTLNIKVMNMSLGVEARSMDYAVRANRVASVSDLANAINRAYDLGVVSVVSAGNNHTNASSSSPANIPNAVTISALDPIYNNYIEKKVIGVEFAQAYSNYGDVIDFAAPGTNIKSSMSRNYSKTEDTMSGTSMAAPHASACFALVLSNPYYADFSCDNIVQLFNVSAVDYGNPGKDIYYGYGLINISDIGVIKSGSVEFSVSESVQENPISVALSYNSDNTVRIYYSLDETIESIEPVVSTKIKLYSSPINLSQTTKITCMAFVYDSHDNLIKKSALSTKTYYFDNLDLESSYTFEEYSYGLVLSKYSGELVTLKVPKTVGTKNVVQIKGIAFNSSSVNVLYLPESISLIDENAFNGNQSLKEIYLQSPNVEIGKNAFRNAKKLEIVDMQKVSKVGDFAFAYCEKLRNICLKDVTTIGKHSFSYSGLKTILLGKNLESLGVQYGLGLETVYGFESTSAVNLPGTFVDLTLRTSALDLREVLERGQHYIFEADVFGIEPVVSVKGVTALSCEVEETQVSDYQRHIRVDINTASMLLSNYQIYLQISDYYETPQNSQEIQLDIVPAGTQKFSFDTTEVSDKVSIYVDGNMVENGDEKYKNVTYTLDFVVDEGYQIDHILINNTAYSGVSVVLPSVNSDLEIEVSVRVINTFSITFATDEHAKVFVADAEVSDMIVSRGQNLTFKVAFDVGYDANIVTLNGQEIYLTRDKTYTLLNILNDFEIEIGSAESIYTVTLSIGKGVNALSSNGRIEQLSDDESKTYVVEVAEGDTKTYIISTLDGYRIESVFVNGQKRSFLNNAITLENISDNYDIVVSLAKKETRIWESDSIIVKYLLVFLGLFVVFVLAKILLVIIRKEKNQTETKMFRR